MKSKHFLSRTAKEIKDMPYTVISEQLPYGQGKSDDSMEIIVKRGFATVYPVNSKYKNRNRYRQCTPFFIPLAQVLRLAIVK